MFSVGENYLLRIEAQQHKRQILSEHDIVIIRRRITFAVNR